MKGPHAELADRKEMWAIVHGNPLPMWIYDRETLRFLEVSKGAIRHYGYSRAEFRSMTIRDLIPRGVEEHREEHSVDPSVKGQGDQAATTCRHRDGRLLYVETHSNAMVYDGRMARLVVARDLNPREKRHAEAAAEGQLDAATGLPNASLLRTRAQQAFENADRTRRRVAIVRLELDQYDEVLAQFGSAASDTCLRQVGTWLTRRLRGMDTVGRLGDKEFALVLAELDDDFDLYRVATALLKIFAEPTYIEGKAVLLSASLGIAVYPEDGKTFELLQQESTVALERARQSGGHRIALFSKQGAERTELDVYMREMMKQNRFLLHYQPEYSPDGEVRALEALLRLPGKDGGFLSPDRFIPIAEETGLIEPLGLWVIKEAARQSREWRDRYGASPRIAVNVSPLQLRSRNFAAEALAVLQACAVDPWTIEFEITERAVLEFDEVAKPMRELAKAGITFAVDDFGTGYSSLQHLHRLPISILKIDRSFVQRMDAPRGTEAIVEAIVSMAHSLGMHVVAEGVETEAQRKNAIRMGCDVIQGFLHSRPVGADAIPALMGWKTRERAIGIREQGPGPGSTLPLA
jgi:diguanylate cyclase (GGDEF)-like protein/PAS domain S-box-containing protein